MSSIAEQAYMNSIKKAKGNGGDERSKPNNNKKAKGNVGDKRLDAPQQPITTPENAIIAFMDIAKSTGNTQPLIQYIELVEKYMSISVARLILDIKELNKVQSQIYGDWCKPIVPKGVVIVMPSEELYNAYITCYNVHYMPIKEQLDNIMKDMKQFNISNVNTGEVGKMIHWFNCIHGCIVTTWNNHHNVSTKSPEEIPENGLQKSSQKAPKGKSKKPHVSKKQAEQKKPHENGSQEPSGGVSDGQPVSEENPHQNGSQGPFVGVSEEQSVQKEKLPENDSQGSSREASPSEEGVP